MSLRLREKLNIIELDTVDSTNLYAKANLADLADLAVAHLAEMLHGAVRI